MKLSVDAADSLGWAVSHSTVIRALLRYAEQQDSTWLSDQLLPLIKEEGSLARHRTERSELLRRTHDK
jgi:broad specificity phosphatase PhoE